MYDHYLPTFLLPLSTAISRWRTSICFPSNQIAFSYIASCNKRRFGISVWIGTSQVCQFVSSKWLFTLRLLEQCEQPQGTKHNGRIQSDHGVVQNKSKENKTVVMSSSKHKSVKISPEEKKKPNVTQVTERRVVLLLSSQIFAQKNKSIVSKWVENVWTARGRGKFTWLYFVKV